MRAVITGTGMAVPDQRLTNADIEGRVDTSDAWIVERTGIRERRVAAADETTSSLAIAAGAAAIKDAGVTPDEVDLVLVATLTPDQQMPSTAAFVQDGLGLRAGALDVGAACAGFVYGLITASAMVEAGRAQCVLVIGAETLTRVTDPDDRGTLILFGDGAGACVVQASDDGDAGLLSFDVGCDGSLAHILEIPAGEPYVRMEGREVFRRAVRVVVSSAEAALAQAGLTAADVDVFVPHQANARIVTAACERLGIAADRTVLNLDRFGNTSAASVPMALAETRPRDGDVVLLSGFGAGMTWASAVLRWKEAA